MSTPQLTDLQLIDDLLSKVEQLNHQIQTVQSHLDHKKIEDEISLSRFELEQKADLEQKSLAEGFENVVSLYLNKEQAYSRLVKKQLHETINSFFDSNQYTSKIIVELIQTIQAQYPSQPMTIIADSSYSIPESSSYQLENSPNPVCLVKIGDTITYDLTLDVIKQELTDYFFRRITNQ